MAIVEEDATTVDTAYNAGTTGITVNYGATVNADDALILGLYCSSTSHTWTTPSGWTLIGGSNFRRTYIKAAAGTEGGGSFSAVTNSGGSAYLGACIYRYSGVDVSGSIVEGYAATGSSGSTVTIPDLGANTSGPNHLCVNVFMSSKFGTGAITANDDALNYSEFDDQSVAQGSYAIHFKNYSYVQPTAGKPGSDSYTLTASLTGASIVQALIAATAAGYSEKPLSVTPANVGKVATVLSANIGNIMGA